jgi:hypothetical protein
MQENKAPTPPPKLVWPRYALAAVIIFVLLAVVWVGFAVKRTRDQNPWNPLPGQQATNS